MKRIYRYKSVTDEGKTFRNFATKLEIEQYINSLDFDTRDGYTISFKDGSKLTFKNINNDNI